MKSTFWLLLGFSSLTAMAHAAGTPVVKDASLPSAKKVLSHVYPCSKTLVLRSQALAREQEKEACAMLGKVEQRFHSLFNTQGKPVAHDNNTSLRMNIYAGRDDFVKYAGSHFDMPVDNGGMYLEGLPDVKGNQAEFVAYQRKDGSIHNLSHEFTHYLDGRFNIHGDFCAGLHDSHDAPENCPKPAPDTPYLIWWTEGIAEYVAHGDNNERAVKAAPQKTYAMSQLFDTGYLKNGGTDRVYIWGYLGARYMMEKQRDKVEQLLSFTRKGDMPRAQALMRQWGTSMDADFAAWLDALKPAEAAK
jgi:microbial collagenase